MGIDGASVFLLVVLLCCAVGISWLGLLRHRDVLHPAVVFPCIYTYFAAGNAVLHVCGIEIYSGVRVYYLRPALLVFIYAVLAFGAGALLVGRSTSSRKRVRALHPADRARLGQAVAAVALLLNLLAYALVVPRMSFAGPKSLLLADAGYLRSLHYNYLVVWLVVCAMALGLWEKPWRAPWYFLVNFSGYVIYCLLCSERDFVLLGLVYLVARSAFGQARFSVLKVVSFASIIVVVFSSLLVVRAAAGDDVTSTLGESVLSQGSNLMVLTNILDWMEYGMSPRYGMTYLESLVNLLSPLTGRVGVPLATWFRDTLAPGSPAGYGFSLESEAYLNFRIPGVLLFFFGFGAFFSAIYARMRSSALLGFFGLYFYLLAIYAIRGDSLMLFKASVYGLLIILAIVYFGFGGRVQVVWRRSLSSG